MFAETTLLFKTMVILSGQIGIVFGLAYFIIQKAKVAFENKTKLFGYSFRGAMNMNKELDLVPYIESPKKFPVFMTKLVAEEFDHEYADQWPAGEEYIQNHISKFLRTNGASYKQERNFPAIDATAKLSPYINAGIVSSKWCLVKAKEYNDDMLDDGNKGIVHWVSEILWREFYRHIIYNFPKVSKNLPFIDYTKNIPWNEDSVALQRWKDGKTGIPIVI